MGNEEPDNAAQQPETGSTEGQAVAASNGQNDSLLKAANLDSSQRDGESPAVSLQADPAHPDSNASPANGLEAGPLQGGASARSNTDDGQPGNVGTPEPMKGSESARSNVTTGQESARRSSRHHSGDATAPDPSKGDDSARSARTPEPVQGNESARSTHSNAGQASSRRTSQENSEGAGAAAPLPTTKGDESSLSTHSNTGQPPSRRNSQEPSAGAVMADPALTTADSARSTSRSGSASAWSSSEANTDGRTEAATPGTLGAQTSARSDTHGHPDAHVPPTKASEQAPEQGGQSESPRSRANAENSTDLSSARGPAASDPQGPGDPSQVATSHSQWAPGEGEPGSSVGREGGEASHRTDVTSVDGTAEPTAHAAGVVPQTAHGSAVDAKTGVDGHSSAVDGITLADGNISADDTHSADAAVDPETRPPPNDPSPQDPSTQGKGPPPSGRGGVYIPPLELGLRKADDGSSLSAPSMADQGGFGGDADDNDGDDEHQFSALHRPTSEAATTARGRTTDPAEVEGMALYLGVGPDELYLYGIAAEACLAPVIPPWEEARDDAGNPVFHNVATGRWSKRHPLDYKFLRLVQKTRAGGAPEGKERVWMKFASAGGGGATDGGSSGASGDNVKASRMAGHHDNDDDAVSSSLGGDSSARPAGEDFYYNFKEGSILRDRVPDAGEIIPSVPPGDVPKYGSEELGDGLFSQSVFNSAFDADAKQRFSRPAWVDDPGAIASLKELRFKSWWSADGKRAFATLVFSMETQTFDMIMEKDKDMVIRNLTKVTTKTGLPVQCWDLHVGASLLVLGKATTLMQGSLATVRWVEHFAKQLRKTKADLEKELYKYERKALPAAVTHERGVKQAGGVNLRNLITQVEKLKAAVGKYRPSIRDSKLLNIQL